MKIRALVSFSGAISMYTGEEREYNNEFVLSDLLKAGYVEEVKAEKEEKQEELETEKVEESQKEEKQEELETEKVEESSKKGVKNESKRNNNKKSS